MLLRLCQLKSLYVITLLLLSSCSFFRSEKDQAGELLTPISSEWFGANLQHALVSQAGNPQPHHFFDIKPELGQKSQYVNAFIIVPEGSEHAYQLDPSSGQRFYSHSYCSQSDVWNQYSGSIFKPNFSVGILPRYLDQMGEPQKVVIFGGKKKFSKRTDHHEHRVRIVGSFVEQHCPEGNCLGKSNWISRMVFIAVDPEDSKFEKVYDLNSFQDMVGWRQAKAILENMDGRNGGKKSNYPSVRIGELIKFDEAIHFHETRSIYISTNESTKIAQSCHALYDKLWDQVGKEHPEDKPVKTVEELKEKVKIVQELKKKKLPVGFAARFNAFTKKYFSEISTCQKFVYAGNVNLDREKFWFLSYMGLFYRLHKEGWFYDCNSHSWQRNVLNNLGKSIYDIKQDIGNCKEKDIDLAMEYLPNFLTGLKNSEQVYFRFVDYDNHVFGTHQKLYSWVRVKSKYYDCSTDPNQIIKKELKVFPEDISWKSRDVKDIEDEMKIIY